MLTKYDNDLKLLFDDYPELELSIIGLDYKHEDVINFIRLHKIKDIKDFSVSNFKNFLTTYYSNLNQIKTNFTKSPNPCAGDLVLNQQTNQMEVFDGSQWISISTPAFHTI